MPRVKSALPGQRIARALIFGFVLVLLYGGAIEFYNMAWGTGSWYGQLSLKWGLALAVFGVACVVIVIVSAGLTFGRWGRWPGLSFAERLPSQLRWLMSGMAIGALVWLLQYSPLGVVIAGAHLRLLLWLLCISLLAILLPAVARNLPVSARFYAAILASGSVVTAASALVTVTDYPFSLGWSEGNRLWDYSLLFGRRLYSYGSGQPPVAYLDLGRQLIGGLPFILPKITILDERLWLAIVDTVPYLVLSLLTFYPRERTKSAAWVFAGLFGFLFLSQGPIHAPILVSAILVSAARKLSLGWAVPLVAISGFFAETSRFTWIFAPAMWAVMLEIGAAELQRGRLERGAWKRAIALGLAGLAGGAIAYTGILSWDQTSQASSAAVSTSQALLWQRLLPNSTYQEGILLGLLQAAGPLLLILGWAGKRYWRPNRTQLLAILLPLAAFLVVGLVVSTKIGGGGDLHNLDMFLIGLLFTAAIFWSSFGKTLGKDVPRAPALIGAVLILLLALPAYGPLRSLRPLSFARDEAWLSVLTDAARPHDLGSLPAEVVVQADLEQLRDTVEMASEKGQVLFMDQRQLLTFGYLRGIELVPEYEKKLVMDKALSGDAAYFDAFYKDLEAHRFSMIVSSPLRTPIRDSDYGFAEENNAWVKWVAKPILCYYAEQDTLDDVKVELLVPRTEPLDCSGSMPWSDG